MSRRTVILARRRSEFQVWISLANLSVNSLTASLGQASSTSPDDEYVKIETKASKNRARESARQSRG